MDLSNLNYLAILVAAIAGMVSGAAWYGAFAKPWMKAVGYTEEPTPNPKIYIVAIIAQLIIAYMLAVLFRHFPSVDLVSGALGAFFCWLGFCLAPMAVNHRFQDKGWDLTLIDGGYWLVVFLLQGAILGWWGA
ncbi:MAG: DUF1761 domain-containing protein [Rhizobiaceae bacterium]|nr:DUF1761 domain-containing protein [Rhizobiaceae bacterium]